MYKKGVQRRKYGVFPTSMKKAEATGRADPARRTMQPRPEEMIFSGYKKGAGRSRNADGRETGHNAGPAVKQAVEAT